MEIANRQSKTLAAVALAVAIGDPTTTSDVTRLIGDHLRIHDGVQDLKEIGSQAYCTMAGGANACICPEDTPGAKLPPLQSLNPDVKLALTGMETGGVATVQGLSLEDYCGKPSTAEPGAVVWSMVFWSPDMGTRVGPFMMAYTCHGLISTWKANFQAFTPGQRSFLHAQTAHNRRVDFRAGRAGAGSKGEAKPPPGIFCRRLHGGEAQGACA